MCLLFMFIFTSFCGNILASRHMFHTCSFKYKHPYIVTITFFPHKLINMNINPNDKVFLNCEPNIYKEKNKCSGGPQVLIQYFVLLKTVIETFLGPQTNFFYPFLCCLGFSIYPNNLSDAEAAMIFQLFSLSLFIDLL